MIKSTKDQIIEAAIEVFNNDYSAPLQKVAEATDISRRTLHRYFKNREELVKSCEREMEQSCKKAMITAIQSSSDSITQLQNMLYAGIDCGAKYSFFYKLHQGAEHLHEESNQDCADYDYIYRSFQEMINNLQRKGIISKSMTIAWIQNLHAGIIMSTVNASESSNLKLSEIKGFAWKSFINGIRA